MFCLLCFWLITLRAPGDVSCVAMFKWRRGRGRRRRRRRSRRLALKMKTSERQKNLTPLSFFWSISRMQGFLWKDLLAISEIIVCFVVLFPVEVFNGRVVCILFPFFPTPSAVIQNINVPPFVFFWCGALSNNMQVSAQGKYPTLQKTPGGVVSLPAFRRCLCDLQKEKNNSKKTNKQKEHVCIFFPRQRRSFAVCAVWLRHGGIMVAVSRLNKRWTDSHLLNVFVRLNTENWE